MARALAILLALLLGVANSLCACVQGAAAAPDVRASAPARSHCHSQAPAEEARPCHSGDNSKEHREQCSCGHCTGSIAADVAHAKVLLKSADLSPLLFAAILPGPLGLDTPLARHRYEHTGLSPPLGPVTLLSLFCSQQR